MLERSQDDALHRRTDPANVVQRLGEWVVLVNLVVAIRADHQKTPDTPMFDQVPQELERGVVEPLQIIEEQRERMLRPREDLEYALENEQEALLGLVRGRGLRGLRLTTDEQLEIGNELHHLLAVGLDGGEQRSPPASDIGITAPKNLAHQALECVRERRKRDIAFELIEFTGGKESSRRDEDAMNFVDESGFPIPEYPETNTSSDVPVEATRSNSRAKPRRPPPARRLSRE